MLIKVICGRCSTIYHRITSMGFQRDRGKLGSWAQSYQMVFNLSKCFLCCMGSLLTRSDRQDWSGPKISSTIHQKHYHWNSSVLQMLYSLSLESLKGRRKIHRLCAFYHAYNNIITLPVPHYYQRSLRVTRSQLTYIRPCTCDDYCLSSFFPRTIKNWNLIPPAIRAENYSNFCNCLSSNP